MGACATKPKVAKEESQAPHPPPEPAKEEMPAAAVVEQSVATAVGGEEEKKVAEKEIGEGDQPVGDKVKEVVVDADEVADDGQSIKKNGEKQLKNGGKTPTEHVKSENDNIIEPLIQEPLVTGGPIGSEKQVQSLAEATPEVPIKLDKSGTEKFVEAPEMLPAEEKFDSPKGPTPFKAVIDAPGTVEAEKLIEGTATAAATAQTKSS